MLGAAMDTQVQVECGEAWHTHSVSSYQCSRGSPMEADVHRYAQRVCRSSGGGVHYSYGQQEGVA